MKVKVRTPARLHFGVLNPGSSSSRGYGGVGLAVEGAGYDLMVSRSSSLEVVGPEEQLGRAVEAVETVAAAYGLSPDVKVDIRRGIPRHAGLGSTTQLTLGVGKALTALSGEERTSREIAERLGRGRFSGVGTYAFECGGFVVEGGSKKGAFPPLLCRHEFPDDWCFVTAIPDVERGPREEGEAELFEGLGGLEELAGRICFSLVLEMLPSLVSHNIGGFGSALSKLDRMVGEAFSPKQGGTFRSDVAAEICDFMLKRGAYGTGQSSWGPAVYGLIDEGGAPVLSDALEELLVEEGFKGQVLELRPDNGGARVEVPG